MYERIVLKGTDIKDGSENLPSSLIFSQQTQYNSNPINSPVTKTYSINSRMIKAKSTKALVNYSDSDQYGNLLNGSKQVFEFVIKFSDCYLNYDKSNLKIYFRSKALNNIYEACNNNLVSMRYNSSTLKKNFFFIEIPDYSFQSMTMKNYDMLPKVFIDENRKIPDSCIALIKSYTFKKTWIMIDKKYCNVSDTNDMKIIIDFRYHSDLVKDNKLYYENFNNYSNLQDLYNERKYRSPYLDKYWINYNDEDKNSLKYLVNTQDKRFTFDFKQKESNRNKDNPVYTVSKLLMRSDSNAPAASSDKVLFSIGSSGLDNYFKSLDYEVYEYDTTTDSYGYRKIPADGMILGDTDSNKFYEIFPVMRGLVHYIFKFKGTDNTKLTLETLKSWMRVKKIYLNNYDIQNFNIFKCKVGESTTNTYVEIYSQIPVDGESNIKEPTETLPDADKEIFVIPSLELTDEKYSYDPTNMYGLNYKRSNESPELLLPFYSSDKFISTNLQKRNARIIDFTVSNKKNTLMWRDKNVSLEDYNFNILANSEETTPSPQLSLDTIQGYFSGTGFREEEETVSNDDGSYRYEIIKTIESQLSQLNENLYKLITTENKNATSETSNTIENNENNDKFLFIYFNNDSDYVTVNFTIKKNITNCSGVQYSNVVIPINLKPVSNTTTYIIPALSVYSKVQLPKSQTYYMVS